MRSRHDRHFLLKLALIIRPVARALLGIITAFTHLTTHHKSPSALKKHMMNESNIRFYLFQEAIAEPEIATADKGLYVLGQKSFNNHIREGNHFVKFYAPWCGHCQGRSDLWKNSDQDWNNR